MFKVINIENKEILYAKKSEEAAIRKLYEEKKLKCPCCGGDVIFKCGDKMITHFAHKSNPECPFNEYESETYAHLKGKQILYNWLIDKFKEATVEMEVFIPETGQIADIFVHIPQTEKTPEVSLAFEFQHSSLSEEVWRRRSSLYNEAGIIDFWILDAKKFINYSRARGWNHARNHSKLGDTIFNHTGFTYFLNIENEELIVDFEFGYRYDSVNANGRIRRAEYKVHEPQEHHDSLKNFNIKYISKYHIAFLNSDKLSEGIIAKVKRIKSRLEALEQRQLEEFYENKQSDLVLLLEKNEEINTDAISYISSFIIKNTEKNDFIDTENSELCLRFKEQIKLINYYYLEYRKAASMNEELSLQQRILKEIWYFNDIFNSDLISWGNAKNIFDIFSEIYKEDLHRIKYVYETHYETLEKLTKYRYKYVDNILENIKGSIRLYSEVKNPLEVALKFKRYESFEDIDSIINQINYGFEEHKKKIEDEFRRL